MRKIILAGTALAMSVIMSMTAFAGTWSQDGSGDWLYKHDDGTLSTNEWVETSGKWYYTGTDGKMATNCTVDGYTLGSDGAWVTSNSTLKNDEYTRENRYDKDGNLLCYITYEYNNNRKTKMNMYSSNGVLAATFTDYQYDDKGRCTRTPIFSIAELIFNGYENYTEFDEHDNPVKTTLMCTDLEPQIEYYSYEYDNKGNLIKKSDCISDINKTGPYYTYEYDEYGNKIRTTHKNADGTLRYHKDFQYDAQGNVISSIRYNPDGSVAERLEYIR